MGLRVFAFQLLLGNRHPPARSQASYVTDLITRFLGCRGGCIAGTQIALWMHSLYSNSYPVHRSCYGSALQTYVAQESGDVRPHWLFFFCVLHRRLASTLGTVEHNKYWNIISIYVSTEVYCRIASGCELGLKHLGNNLQTMSKTTSLLPPFPPAVQSKPTS